MASTRRGYAGVDVVPSSVETNTGGTTWRGMALYPLHGPAVITGRIQDGGVAPLGDDLAQHARAVAQTVRETLIEWQARHPATNEAAIAELLAYAFRDVAADR